MAKKKKQAAANPARGFATTSIASKPKVEDKPAKPELPISEDRKSKEHGNAPPSQIFDGVRGVDARGDNGERELHELSPEEMTEQLERNELQMLVDNNASKVRKERSRLDAKLRTDSRILRAQAQLLSSRKWLPLEIMIEIIDLLRLERRNDPHSVTKPRKASHLSDDDLSIKLWTLWQALSEIGISTENIKSAIREIVQNPPANEATAYIWAWREALEYLALELDIKELPVYDERRPRAVTSDEISSENDSGSTTPRTSLFAATEHVSESGTPKRQSNELQIASIVSQDDINLSDFESDAEPEDMVATYLALKERLYRHDPDLVEAQQPQRGKKAKQVKSASVNRPLKPNEARLHSKMQEFERDVLFDSLEADQRWAMRRIQLAQEMSSTRATIISGIGDAPDHQDSGMPKASSNEPIGEQLIDSDTVGAGSPDGSMIGDMFAVPDEVPHLSVSSPDVSAQENVVLRDMGKFTGLSPRRILEDVCRGRDSKARVSFKRVSLNTYASRHALTIRWSVDQDKLTTRLPPFLMLEQLPSTKGPEFSSATAFSMTNVANPDERQSEAFIATVALFYLSSNVPKEEKQYQKLPPNFRDLYLELSNHQKEQENAADRETLKIIRQIMHDHRIDHGGDDEEDGVVLITAFRSRGMNSPRPGSSRGVSPTKLATRGSAAENANLWHTIQSSPRYQNMLRIRMNLPMYGFKSTALEGIAASQVVILCGETGCGKSTQLPSYILEHELSQGRDCKIYCTQPRRISAISLAQRVSEEIGEAPGDVGTSRSLVGYAIRLESKVTSRTRLVYATVGVVLRMLESSKALDDITHLILDEVHERSIDTDFLLIVLLTLMQRRPELKVVLMSATVDATRFSKYLNGAPIINVPGRTFPVQTKYLEDAIELVGVDEQSIRSDRPDLRDHDDLDEVNGKSSGATTQLQGYSTSTREALSGYDEYAIDHELILRLMERVATDPAYSDFSKATLIFLPGIAEIRELNDLLTGSKVFQHNCWVIPLHSTIASEEQQLAFKIPPPGVRKVVLATNIAETGITIPDVTCVIDTGKHKEMRFDERRQMSRLIQSFISRANAKQRRGRAGRVQEGLCFHLFTRYRHDEIMAEQQTPEMLRLSLQDLVMRVKICGLGQIEDTLASALDPPSAKNVRRAIDALIEVGALTSKEELTVLGSQLAKLPLDANLGKLCLMSSIFGCLDVGLTISAILSSKSPFVTPFGDRQRADLARLAFSRGDSDLLTAYNAYTAWRRTSQTSNQNVYNFCRKNFLSHQNLSNIEDLKAQLLSSLTETGLVKIPRSQIPRSSRGRHQVFVQVPPELDTNSGNELITSSVIAWSFYPKVLIREGKGFRNISNSQQVSLHPTSVNKGNNEIKYLSYYSMMASSAGAKFYNALSTTAVADLPLLLGAGDADFKIHAGTIVIDGNRLRFRVDNWKDILALKFLRTHLEDLVHARLKEPGKEVTGRAKRWLAVWESICNAYMERQAAR